VTYLNILNDLIEDEFVQANCSIKKDWFLKDFFLENYLNIEDSKR
jgi:hypothetical protein